MYSCNGGYKQFSNTPKPNTNKISVCYLGSCVDISMNMSKSPMNNYTSKISVCYSDTCYNINIDPTIMPNITTDPSYKSTDDKMIQIPYHNKLHITEKFTDLTDLEAIKLLSLPPNKPITTAEINLLTNDNINAINTNSKDKQYIILLAAFEDSDYSKLKYALGLINENDLFSALMYAYKSTNVEEKAQITQITDIILTILKQLRKSTLNFIMTQNTYNASKNKYEFNPIFVDADANNIRNIIKNNNLLV